MDEMDAGMREQLETRFFAIRSNERLLNMPRKCIGCEQMFAPYSQYERHSKHCAALRRRRAKEMADLEEEEVPERRELPLLTRVELRERGVRIPTRERPCIKHKTGPSLDGVASQDAMFADVPADQAVAANDVYKQRTDFVGTFPMPVPNAPAQSGICRSACSSLAEDVYPTNAWGRVIFVGPSHQHGMRLDDILVGDIVCPVVRHDDEQSVNSTESSVADRDSDDSGGSINDWHLPFESGDQQWNTWLNLFSGCEQGRMPPVMRVSFLRPSDGVVYTSTLRTCGRARCFGMLVAPLTPELTNEKDRAFVEISRVTPGTLAERSGLMAKDKILQFGAINRHAIVHTTAVRIMKEVAEVTAFGQPVQLRVRKYSDQRVHELWLDRGEQMMGLQLRPLDKPPLLDAASFEVPANVQRAYPVQADSEVNLSSDDSEIERVIITVDDNYDINRVVRAHSLRNQELVRVGELGKQGRNVPLVDYREHGHDGALLNDSERDDDNDSDRGYEPDQHSKSRSNPGVGEGFPLLPVGNDGTSVPVRWTLDEVNALAKGVAKHGAIASSWDLIAEEFFPKRSVRKANMLRGKWARLCRVDDPVIVQHGLERHRDGYLRRQANRTGASAPYLERKQKKRRRNIDLPNDTEAAQKRRKEMRKIPRHLRNCNHCRLTDAYVPSWRFTKDHGTLCLSCYQHLKQHGSFEDRPHDWYKRNRRSRWYLRHADGSDPSPDFSKTLLELEAERKQKEVTTAPKLAIAEDENDDDFSKILVDKEDSWVGTSQEDDTTRHADEDSDDDDDVDMRRRYEDDESPSPLAQARSGQDEEHEDDEPEADEPEPAEEGNEDEDDEELRMSDDFEYEDTETPSDASVDTASIRVHWPQQEDSEQALPFDLAACLWYAARQYCQTPGLRGSDKEPTYPSDGNSTLEPFGVVEHSLISNVHAGDLVLRFGSYAPSLASGTPMQRVKELLRMFNEICTSTCKTTTLVVRREGQIRTVRTRGPARLLLSQVFVYYFPNKVNLAEFQRRHGRRQVPVRPSAQAVTVLAKAAAAKFKGTTRGLVAFQSKDGVVLLRPSKVMDNGDVHCMCIDVPRQFRFDWLKVVWEHTFPLSAAPPVLRWTCEVCESDNLTWRWRCQFCLEYRKDKPQGNQSLPSVSYVSNNTFRLDTLEQSLQALRQLAADNDADMQIPEACETDCAAVLANMVAPTTSPSVKSLRHQPSPLLTDPALTVRLADALDGTKRRSTRRNNGHTRHEH
ncbi:MAG: hypothetical protein MHM6MM_001282 [Cercozoa sp. M6MM]